MQLTDIPAKFPIPFANAAGGGFIRPIPTASQIGVNAGYASLTDGFPPLNFTPVAAGGVPPFGQDMNGILNQATAWNRWASAGGNNIYDSGFASSIGGYPAYSTLMSAVVPGNMWMSIVDNNSTDPDSMSSSGWVVAPGTAGTGTVTWRADSNIPYGWIALNNGNIGNAASNALNLASSTALFAFRYFWNNFSNTQCPTLTSAGSSVARGANADADFNANKRIVVLDFRCTTPKGVDTMGSGVPSGLLSGVPSQNGLSASTPGAIFGENTHVLSVVELAAHLHNGSLTTGAESAVHIHSLSGVTDGMNAGDPHSHSSNANTNNSGMSGGGGSQIGTSPAGATISASSVNHGHSYATTTTAESAPHAHSSLFATDPTGSGNAHNTTDRSMLGFILMKL